MDKSAITMTADDDWWLERITIDGEQRYPERITIDGEQRYPERIRVGSLERPRVYVPERTCRMEAFLLGEFFTGRKRVTDTDLSDEEIDKVLLELRDDTVVRCSACHFSVLNGADVTYTQTDDGAWSADAVRSRVNYCPHCGARVVKEEA